jgi:hypothetical protein
MTGPLLIWLLWLGHVLDLTSRSQALLKRSRKIVCVEHLVICFTFRIIQDATNFCVNLLVIKRLLLKDSFSERLVQYAQLHLLARDGWFSQPVRISCHQLTV